MSDEKRTSTPSPARGEVRAVGLFDGTEDFAGLHGVFIVCTPDEAKAIAPMLYSLVELTEVNRG